MRPNDGLTEAQRSQKEWMSPYTRSLLAEQDLRASSATSMPQFPSIPVGLIPANTDGWATEPLFSKTQSHLGIQPAFQPESVEILQFQSVPVGFVSANHVGPLPETPPPQLPGLPPDLATANLPGMGVMTLPRTNPVLPAIQGSPTIKLKLATQHDTIVISLAQRSLLFKLSESVRTKIYRLALVFPTAIYVRRRPFPAEPNLLFTCKQIRKEAQLLFWTENSFQGRDAVYVCTSRARPPQVLYQRKLSVLLEWLDRIGKDKAGLIKKLVVDYDDDCQFNGHPAYLSNWPATAEDVMSHKKHSLAVAAKYSAIKMLRGFLFQGVYLEAIKPVPILKRMERQGKSDQFGALWQLAMEDVAAFLRARE